MVTVTYGYVRAATKGELANELFEKFLEDELYVYFEEERELTYYV